MFRAGRRTANCVTRALSVPLVRKMAGAVAREGLFVGADGAPLEFFLPRKAGCNLDAIAATEELIKVRVLPPEKAFWAVSALATQTALSRSQAHGGAVLPGFRPSCIILLDPVGESLWKGDYYKAVARRRLSSKLTPAACSDILRARMRGAEHTAGVACWHAFSRPMPLNAPLTACGRVRRQPAHQKLNVPHGPHVRSTPLLADTQPDYHSDAWRTRTRRTPPFWISSPGWASGAPLATTCGRRWSAERLSSRTHHLVAHWRPRAPPDHGALVAIHAQPLREDASGPAVAVSNSVSPPSASAHPPTCQACGGCQAARDKAVARRSQGERQGLHGCEATQGPDAARCQRARAQAGGGPRFAAPTTLGAAPRRGRGSSARCSGSTRTSRCAAGDRRRGRRRQACPRVTAQRSGCVPRRRIAVQRRAVATTEAHGRDAGGFGARTRQRKAHPAHRAHGRRASARPARHLGREPPRGCTEGGRRHR
jgi:hypothetical protein